LEGKLVDGFNIDVQTAKPDCVTCTEAKQHVEPFPKSVKRKTEPGELTHIDVWGNMLLDPSTGINTTFFLWTMQNNM
jgi:hypothetical protein